MKRKKRIVLALNLLLGGFVVSTLSGCEGEVSAFYTLDLIYDSTLGSVTSDTPKGVVGDTVNVTITPNEGIVIDSVKVNGEEATVENGVLTFTAVGGTNTVEVTFKDPSAQPPLDTSFSVKAEYDSEKGSVSFDKTAGEDYAAPTSVVKVTITPNSGYFVETITVNGESKDASDTEFVFQPKQGENIVKVTFKESEGPVDEKPTYSFKVTYNEEGGSVVGDVTAGEISEGTVVKFTVTPSDNYEVKAVTFNGNALNISANGIYEVTPIEGENTFDVRFELKEVEPPVQTFTINVNVVNQEGGTYTLSKTEGETGETVTLHVEPTSGYNVQVMFNNELIALDENFDVVLTPISGVNRLDIIFAKPASGLESLEDGYEIDFDYSTLLGTPDFDKTYFAENFFNRIYDAVDSNASNREATIGQIYDSFVSKINITKSTLKHLNTVMDEVDFFNRLKEIASSTQQGMTEENFKNYFSLIVDVKTKLTKQEFSYAAMLFTFAGSSGLMVYGSLNSFGGLYTYDYQKAITYYENKGDTQTANEIKTFFDSVYATDKFYDDAVTSFDQTTLLGAYFAYPMIDALLEIESDKDKLASNFYNAMMLVSSIGSQSGMEELLKPENSAKNIETIKFIGEVLYRAMPNIDSFKKLAEKSDVLKEFVEFANNVRNIAGEFNVNVPYDDLFDAIKKDSDSLYYVFKFIGRSLENITEDDYSALIDLIKAMSSGTSENTEVYKSAIKISKIFVRTLFEFGDAQKLISEKFSTGFSIIGKIIARINRMSEYSIYDTQANVSDSMINDNVKRIYVSFMRGDNVFGNFDFNKIPEFITKVAQYQADKIGETEIAYIESFFNDINAGIGSFFSNENSETFMVEYISNPKLNGDLNIKVTEPSAEEPTKYTIGETDTSKRVNTNFKIDFDGYGEVYFTYTVGTIGFYYNEVNGELINALSNTTKSNNELFIQSDYTFAPTDGLYYVNYNEEGGYSEPKLLLQYSGNLDLSKTGWNFERVEIEGRVYFIKYYVYNKEDAFYKYSLGGVGEIYVGRKLEISYVDYEALVNDGTSDRTISYGSYELAEPFKLDTSKAGENTAEVKLATGEVVKISYYVNEVISLKLFLTCDSSDNDFEFQSLTLDPLREYYFIYRREVKFINQWGSEHWFEEIVWQGYATINDFENKLDNSTAGTHTDYLIRDGEKYEFTYYVMPLLDSSDQEFSYYISEPYLLGEINGFIFEDEIAVDHARRLYFEGANGNPISRIEYDYESSSSFNLAENDLSNVEIGEPGSLKDVEITLSNGNKVTAKLYFSNYEVEREVDSLAPYSQFVMGKLPSDEYEMKLYRQVDIQYNKRDESSSYHTQITGTTEVTFGDIKEYLDLSYAGYKSSVVEANGETFEVQYEVIETLEMGFGDYQNFNNSKFSNYGLHITNLEGQENLVIKARNGYINYIDYLDYAPVGYQEYYEGEYIYYVFSFTNINDLWLSFDANYNSYIEILDPREVDVKVEPYSMVSINSTKNENGDYDIVFEYKKYFMVDGYTFDGNYFYSTFTKTFTVEELKELYIQSGYSPEFAVTVELYGETITVYLNADWFPELIEDEVIL